MYKIYLLGIILKVRKNKISIIQKHLSGFWGSKIEDILTFPPIIKYEIRTSEACLIYEGKG